MSEDTATGLACDRDVLRAALGQGALPDRAKAAVEMTPLPRHTLGEGFELLRAASDAMREKSGVRPRIFQVNLGAPADYTARGTFTQNYFAAGGIETVPMDAGGGDAAAAFAKSGCTFAILCSSDEIYRQTARETAWLSKNLEPTAFFWRAVPAITRAPGGRRGSTVSSMLVIRPLRPFVMWPPDWE